MVTSRSNHDGRIMSQNQGVHTALKSAVRNLHRQKSRPISSIAVSEGDVVTVFEDNLPRSQWKLGRVEELIHGAGDRVRAAGEAPPGGPTPYPFIHQF